MEAVAVEGEGDKEIVIEELQSGYDLAEQNIRHAMVKIKRS
jgi:molecular chaperone GrpE (heat shock protein)